MSPTSYQTALPRDVNGAGAGIRTQAPLAWPTGFQDRTLQPLGYSCKTEMFGGPWRTRTFDHPVMSRKLWPTELRVQIMVARVGVEPTTYRVWTDCSSQLSYLANSLRNKMVGMAGFEPVTSWSQIKHSTKLSYIPIRIGCFGTASKMLWRRSCLAMGAHRIIIMSGGDGGSWTHTVFLPRDFKSLASTIPPHPHLEVPARFEPAITELQSIALPLG